MVNPGGQVSISVLSSRTSVSILFEHLSSLNDVLFNFTEPIATPELIKSKNNKQKNQTIYT